MNVLICILETGVKSILWKITGDPKLDGAVNIRKEKNKSKGIWKDEKHEKKITGYALRRLKCSMVSRCSGGEVIKCAYDSYHIKLFPCSAFWK